MGLDSLAITYANLGLVYAQLGDAAKARENAKNAVETDSAAVSKMIARLTQAVNARPSAQGYLRLGLLNEEVGEAAKAQESFTQARRLDPNVVVPPALDSPGKTP
jgi:cytochrome c-type biogenesis protein CcmH/NrfG